MLRKKKRNRIPEEIGNAGTLRKNDREEEVELWSRWITGETRENKRRKE